VRPAPPRSERPSARRRRPRRRADRTVPRSGTLALSSQRNGSTVGGRVLLGRTGLPRPIDRHAPVLQLGPGHRRRRGSATSRVAHASSRATAWAHRRRSPFPSSRRPHRRRRPCRPIRRFGGRSPACRSGGRSSGPGRTARTATASGTGPRRRRCAAPGPGRTSRRPRPSPAAWRRWPAGRHELGIAGAQDHDPGALDEQVPRGPGQQVEALLRIEPADHAQHRPAVVRDRSRSRSAARGGIPPCPARSPRE
jgi:hypothetical protein